MKRKSGIVIFIALMLPFIIIMEGQAANAKRQGVINTYVGDVIIITPAGSVNASVGFKVEEGMTVVTGEKSTADIYFSQEVVIKVMEKSKVKIEKLKLDNDGEKSSFFVRAGKLFSRITRKLKKGEEYNVRTTSVTASVRGTEFIVDSSEKDGAISCTKGEVAVIKGMEELIVKAGMEIRLFEREQRLILRKIEKGRLRELFKIQRNIKHLDKRLLNDLLRNQRELRKVLRNTEKLLKQSPFRHRGRRRKPVLPGLPF